MPNSHIRPHGQNASINPPLRRRRTSPSAAPEYEVGYKRPPKASQYKPGQSGNPKGRPRGATGLNTLARDTLTSKVRVRTPDGEKRMSKMEAVLQKALELAMKGDARAIMLLISLYRPAVPDAQAPDHGAGNDYDPTETDLQILAKFRDEIRRQLGEGS
jgi:hypothetical protein